MSSTLKSLGSIGPRLLQQKDDLFFDAADYDDDEFCPCPHRYLQKEQDGNEPHDALTWQVVYVCVCLVIMFLALLTDKIVSFMASRPGPTTAAFVVQFLYSVSSFFSCTLFVASTRYTGG